MVIKKYNFILLCDILYIYSSISFHSIPFHCTGEGNVKCNWSEGESAGLDDVYLSMPRNISPSSMVMLRRSYIYTSAVHGE